MKATKLILLLLAALLIGVCIGFRANNAILQRRIERYSRIPDNMPEHITNRMTERLGLDEQQRQNVLALLKTHEDRMKETRERSRAMIDDMIEEMRVEIAQFLTPEQAEKHKQILEELRIRRQERESLRRAVTPPPDSRQ